MANLNIPFLYLQNQSGDFQVDSKSSKIIQSPSLNKMGAIQIFKESLVENKLPKVPNMLLLSDISNGCMVVCRHDAVTQVDKKKNQTTNFMVSIEQKLLCVTDVLPSDAREGFHYKLIDFCFIQSPAAQILSTSQHLIVTLQHDKDNVSMMRLWNHEDGRCIMTSPKQTFLGKEVFRIVMLDDNFFAGLLLALSRDGCIMIVNALTMMLVAKYQAELMEAVVDVKVEKNKEVIQVTLIDKHGKIQVWSTSRATDCLIENEVAYNVQRNSGSIRGSTRKKNLKQISDLQLSMCNYQQFKNSPEEKEMMDLLSFTIKHEAKASATFTEEASFAGRGAHRDILGYQRKGVGAAPTFLVIFQDRIELVEGMHSFVRVQYEEEIQDSRFLFGAQAAQAPVKESWFLACAFMKVWHKQMLFCVDSEFQVLIYDVDSVIKGKKDVDGEKLNVKPLLTLSLFQNARLFGAGDQKRDLLPEERAELFGMSRSQVAELEVEKHRKQISKQVEHLTFHFEEDTNILYTYSKDEGTHKQHMLTWSLQSLLANLKVNNLDKDQKLALCINQLNVLDKAERHRPHKSPYQLLNINNFVAQNYFSKHQHSFFYRDERVTAQTFFVSAEYPSVILGTNFGRIFIVQLFQDIEGRAFPILVIDCHEQSPITQLYVAYSPSRKIKTPGNPTNSIAQDTGGHLIAGSEDGTISVTDLSSKEINEQLANFPVNRSDDPEKLRADKFLEEREHNSRLKRRHSVSDHLSLQHYFNLVRVQPLKVLQNCSFGPISGIIEVQILQNSQMSLQRYLQQAVNDTMRNSHAGKGNDKDSLEGMQALGFAQSNFKDENQLREQADSKFSCQTPEEILINQQHTYGSSQPHSFKELNVAETLAQSSQQPIFNELIPFKARYACLDTESCAAYVLTIDGGHVDVLKMQGLDSAPIGVYEDVLQNLVHAVTSEQLSVYTFSRGGKQLLRKSSYVSAMSMLQLNQQVITLTELQQHFRHAGRVSKQAQQERAGEEADNVYDPFSFKQQFMQDAAHKRSSGAASASGQHQVLDYLSMSLSLPLYYHPHSLFSQKFTKSVKDLLPSLTELKTQLCQVASAEHLKENALNSIKVLRTLVKEQFAWSKRYGSDFSQEFYQAQGAVTPLITGSGEADSRSWKQQMIIVNTKDMINIYKSRMKALQDQLIQRQKKENGGNGYVDNTNMQDAGDGYDAPQAPDISAAYFQNSRWPTRLLSLVHPFHLDPNLDANLELFFGLNVPFLDFRIGVQGIDEAFSFVLGKGLSGDKGVKDRSGAESSRQLDSEELIRLLKTSRIKRLQSEHKFNYESASSGQASNVQFLNSEFWRASAYNNTVMSSFFLSTLVSIVEYAQTDITTLLQDWLNVVQFITSVSPPVDNGEANAGTEPSKLQLLIETMEQPAKPLSVSAISQLMLRKDHSISSCARDMLMKPLMNSGSSLDHIKAEINEWQDLIMDTYLKLKEDSSRQAQHAHPGAGSGGEPHSHAGYLPHRAASEAGGQPHGQIAASGFHSGRTTTLAEGQQPGDSHQSVNHFFGELEIRGLVNLSQFALWSMDGDPKYRIDTDVQNRLCKCTVILTREIMAKFTQSSQEYSNLLTILMQLLQTQMRAKVPTFQTKVIKEDVIKILLRIYDFYKKQLRDEKFLTKVVAENFHLIHPKNSELYLKLTAAKTLLEVGTYFTEDFLKLIHEQATTLREGPEYQKNVLDVLRYFISCSRDTLDAYLIQIVQTLLKCLDPNDEQLRKNSTTPVSHILSIMVKSFPLIAFHRDNQRLAVGTSQGPIAIYDIKTSQKWKVLEGHSKKVSCCEFDVKGNLLASYSADDCTVRIWKAGNAGFFSTIMGGTGRSYKEFKLRPLGPRGDPDERPQAKTGQKVGQGRVQQIKGSQPPAGAKCKIRFVNNDKAIELTRENGDVELHQLAK